MELVLVFGMWFNLNNIVYMEDKPQYVESFDKKENACLIHTVAPQSEGNVMFGKTCAEVIAEIKKNS